MSDRKGSSKRNKTDRAAREKVQRATRLSWNNFRASFGLAPLRAYKEGYTLTAEEAQEEVDSFVAGGGVLLPFVGDVDDDEGQRMDIDEEKGEDEEGGDYGDEDSEDDGNDREVDEREDLRGKGKGKGRQGGFDVAFHPKHPNRKPSLKRPSSRASTANPTTASASIIHSTNYGSESTSNTNSTSKPRTNSTNKQTSLKLREEETIYADIEVDATSGAALAKFLKMQSLKYLVDLQSELLKTDPRTFQILNSAFNRISLGPKPHESPHALNDTIYNPHIKNSGPWPVNIVLPEENIDYLPSEREKAAACVVEYDSKGRGVNAANFVKNNILTYLRTSAGARNITTHSRILSSLPTASSRTSLFTNLQQDSLLGIQKVNQIYSAHFVTGYRLVPTLRHAFDITIRDLKGPKSIFVNSSDWFLSTIEVVNSHPEFCLLYFEEETEKFLEMLMGAAEKADLLRKLMMLEVRPKEEYMDLMGEERDRKFEDEFLKVPVENLV